MNEELEGASIGVAKIYVVGMEEWWGRLSSGTEEGSEMIILFSF